MRGSFPGVLNISGFDPSAGAGVLAEIKTLESLKVYGFGVCTAITIQNDLNFEGVQWVKPADIIKQIEITLKRFEFSVVKIGLIENFETLNSILLFLRKKLPDVKIIWDPIFKASAGFTFHEAITFTDIERLCKKIFLLTPNKEEIKKFADDKYLSEVDIAKKINVWCNVLLKDGHGEGEVANDLLFTNGRTYEFPNKRLLGVKKHGSGCVLTSAISAFLAMGYPLEVSCENAREYVQNYLQTGVGQLGFHFEINSNKQLVP